MKSLAFSILVNAVAFLSLFSLGINAQNAGSPDTSFGTNGFVYTQLNGPFAKLSDMAIQPDNKLIVVSYSQIARFNQNGTLDTSFAGDGVWDGGLCRPNAVQVLPDGKIIFGGIYDVQTSIHLCIGRLNSNGTLDTSFDSDGFVQTMMGIESQASSINALPDGKILVAGWTSLQTTFNRDYAMVKYNVDGSLDTTFGTGGRVATELGSNEFSYASAIQSDGKIILVGDYTDSLSSQAMAAIVRYNSNGTVDTGFGTNGKVFRLAAQYGKADDVEIQSDGKIIIAGPGIVPARYNSNGTLDIEFNTPAWIYSSALAIQADGKILVSGATDSNNLILARYNISGTLDTSFGTGGIVSNTGGMSPTYLFPNRILLTSDNKIVLGGTRNNSNFEIVLARYLNNSTRMDFDGDSKTDLSIFRPSVGEWWYLKSSNGGNYAAQFGSSTDKLTPGDFTGDGKTDIAFWRPSTGEWFVLRSEDASYYSYPFGTNGDIPAVGDFESDGKADTAVFRPSSATWFIRRSSDGGATIQQFGANGDVPVVADYDGDGKSDIAIYRPSLGEWWLSRSTAGVIAFQFGNSADKPVQGDYTGDGKGDVGIFRPSTGEWFVLRSEDQSYYSFPFGISTDIPSPGDYDGDGKFDAGVFRPSSATWYVQRSTAGTLIQSFGQSGDMPVPNAFVP